MPSTGVEKPLGSNFENILSFLWSIFISYYGAILTNLAKIAILPEI